MAATTIKVQPTNTPPFNSDYESFEQGWTDGITGLPPDRTTAKSLEDYLGGYDMGARRRREFRPSVVTWRNIRLDEHGFVQGDPVVKEAR